MLCMRSFTLVPQDLCAHRHTDNLSAAHAHVQLCGCDTHAHTHTHTYTHRHTHTVSVREMWRRTLNAAHNYAAEPVTLFLAQVV
jgi:hypothetical protein